MRFTILISSTIIALSINPNLDLPDTIGYALVFALLGGGIFDILEILLKTKGKF